MHLCHLFFALNYCCSEIKFLLVYLLICLLLDHIGIPGTPQRINPSISPRNTLSSNAVVLKRISSKSQSTTMVSTNCKADVAPIIVPRDDVRLEQIESKREAFSKRNNFHPSQLKTADFRRFVNANEKSDGSIITMQPEMTGIMAPEMSGVVNKSSMKTESNSSSQPVTSSPLDNCMFSARLLTVPHFLSGWQCTP